MQAGQAPSEFALKSEAGTPFAVANAFRILMADKGVRAVFINIFGGILRVDVLARGIVDAARTVSIGVPVVVRLEGTNVEAGRKILAESGLPIIQAQGMTDAAQKVVAAVGGR